MLKSINPVVDQAVKPSAGHSRGGQPLSYNRAPAPDLAPWIGRLYATQVELPDTYCLKSGLFNDTSFIRIQLSGEWTAQTADGPRAYNRAAIVFGPQRKLMPVTVTGSFISVGISLRPGTGFALLKLDASQMLDRMAMCNDMGLDGEGVLRALEAQDSAEGWLTALENRFRAVVKATGGAVPDPVSSAFETLTFAEPQANVAEFAEELGISQRQLERIVRRDFGLPPKQMLRRARALDMASRLHGVADEAEGEDFILRYFDQAQMTREFSEFFGMTPRKFMQTPNPLLTLTLESRQSRRLEALERIGPDGKRPWMV